VAIESVNLFSNRIVVTTIVFKQIAIDEYVIDVLMRDLVGHDRAPSAFLVYLHLWAESRGQTKGIVRTSHQSMAEMTGLSKSAVQQSNPLLGWPQADRRDQGVYYGNTGIQSPETVAPLTPEWSRKSASIEPWLS
jgi:hypothetical protein